MGALLVFSWFVALAWGLGWGIGRYDPLPLFRQTGYGLGQWDPLAITVLLVVVVFGFFFTAWLFDDEDEF